MSCGRAGHCDNGAGRPISYRAGAGDGSEFFLRAYRDSGGSQFFIVHEDSPGLDQNYAAFGRVVEGIEIVDAITKVEIDTYGRYGPTDRPHPVPVVIDAVRIERPDVGVAEN